MCIETQAQSQTNRERESKLFLREKWEETHKKNTHHTFDKKKNWRYDVMKWCKCMCVYLFMSMSVWMSKNKNRPYLALRNGSNQTKYSTYENHFWFMTKPKLRKKNTTNTISEKYTCLVKFVHFQVFSLLLASSFARICYNFFVLYISVTYNRVHCIYNVFFFSLLLPHF